MNLDVNHGNYAVGMGVFVCTLFAIDMATAIYGKIALHLRLTRGLLEKEVVVPDRNTLDHDEADDDQEPTNVSLEIGIADIKCQSTAPVALLVTLKSGNDGDANRAQFRVTENSCTRIGAPNTDASIKVPDFEQEILCQAVDESDGSMVLTQLFTVSDFKDSSGSGQRSSLASSDWKCFKKLVTRTGVVVVVYFKLRIQACCNL